MLYIYDSVQVPRFMRQWIVHPRYICIFFIYSIRLSWNTDCW